MKKIGNEEAGKNLNVSNALMSVLFTTHNILRQNSNNATNMRTKSSGTDFPVNFKGKTYTLSREMVESVWKSVLATTY